MANRVNDTLYEYSSLSRRESALAELVIVRVPLTIRSLSLSAFVLWMNVEPALRLPPFLYPPRAFSLHLSVTDWPSSVSPLPSLSLPAPRSLPLSLFSLSLYLFLFVSPLSLSLFLFLCLSFLSALSTARQSRTRSVTAVDPYAAKHRNTAARYPRLLASPTDSYSSRHSAVKIAHSTSIGNRCKLLTRAPLVVPVAQGRLIYTVLYKYNMPIDEEGQEYLLRFLSQRMSYVRFVNNLINNLKRPVFSESFSTRFVESVLFRSYVTYMLGCLHT